MSASHASLSSRCHLGQTQARTVFLQQRPHAARTRLACPVVAERTWRGKAQFPMEPLESPEVVDVSHPEGSPLKPQQLMRSASPPGDEAGELQDESRDFAVAMAQIAHETKGSDICVLHVAPLIFWTRYMMFVTVFSRPQLGAVLGKIEKEAAEKWDRRLSQGGHPSTNEWEVLDLGDVVIHVFTAEQREHYDLETFYSAAEDVELPFVTDSTEQQREGSKDLSWASVL